MSIKHTFIFDNKNEIIYNESLVENITTIDDVSLVNPFESGTVTTPGADAVTDGDIVSGYVTPSGSFTLTASGDLFHESVSGEVISFDFNEPRKLYKIDIYQNPDNYAIDYKIYGDSVEIISVSGSSNSGLISHVIANPIEVQEVDIKVLKINANLNTYEFIEVSGQAEKGFEEERILRSDIKNLTATSIVEPVNNLYDENDLTFWQSNNSYPQNVIWEFKEDQNISRFDYVSEDSLTYPTAFTLYKSDDGVTYTSIHSEAGLTSGDLSINFNPPETLMFLKWRITGGIGNKVRIREVDVYSKTYPQVDENTIQLRKVLSNGLTDALSLMATSESGSHVISNVITDNSNYWQSNNGFSYNSGLAAFIGQQNITIDLGEPKTLNKLLWSNYISAGTPIDFAVYGSDDNITYDKIKEVTGNQQTGASIICDDVETYRFFQLRITKSNATYTRLNFLKLELKSYAEEGSVQLPEIQLDEINEITSETVEPYPATSIRYILMVNGSKYWFNGTSWAASNGTSTNSNSLSVINSNAYRLAEQFGENMKISAIAVLISDTNDTPELNSLSIDSLNRKNSVFIPANLIRVKGFLSGYPGNLIEPIEMQVHLRRSAILLDGETIGFNLTKIYSDNSGYFDFMLPQTENANPEKARFVITVPAINLRRERYTPAQSEISLADWLAGNF